MNTSLFINKVLSEHTLFPIVNGCFPSTELSSHYRHHVTCKVQNIYYLILYRERLLVSDIDSGAKLSNFES